MYNKVTTLTEFVLEEEEKFPEASGSFTLLINAIGRATKIIASHVKHTGLADVIGQTGDINTSGDQVKKLDILSNEIMMETLRGSKQVHIMASEELEETMKVNDRAHYDVFFDPLDGSSNIDVNVNIGTIFSIYKKTSQSYSLVTNRLQQVMWYMDRA